MIHEIQVINPGGIPLFYHSEMEKPDHSTHILQASFITALTQFAEELQNGQVKLVSMEQKNYLLAKSNNFIIIFTSTDESPEEIIAHNSKITEAATYFGNKINEYGLDPSSPALYMFDEALDDFNSYLVERELITQRDDYTASSFRNEVKSLIFKSVGYEPGRCNIGRAERLKRLAFGLFFFALSITLFSIMILLNLPTWVRLFLVVPNFLGFLGFYQYFYQFCTTNAMSSTYDME